MNTINYKFNEKAGEKTPKSPTGFLSKDVAAKARNFHRTCEDYGITPLRRLSRLSAHLGVSDIFVKDESYRFGLNAFKVLGAAYAIAKYLAERLEMPIEELSFELLKSEETKRKLGDITFVTATDGNHGRGVAWAAQQLGQKAVVYMPKGSSLIRLHAIQAHGAEARIEEMNYDECVRLCAELAAERGWVVVQDTAWEGYEQFPAWIMQGYSTIGLEAIEQMKELGKEKPTHIFLQAGVGSFAASIQGLFVSMYGEARPSMVIVEPDKADCFYRSALAMDGKPRMVGGDMNTIMAGLACGEPNPIAWSIIDDYCDLFVSCPDYVAAKGMRVLGNPLADDPRVIAGESGAVTAGIVHLLMTDAGLKEAKERLGLGPDSTILLINTEGDTDPEHYRKIVWNGGYSSESESEPISIERTERITL
jgi:diaminopropionate ammonia-lyase